MPCSKGQRGSKKVWQVVTEEGCKDHFWCHFCNIIIATWHFTSLLTFVQVGGLNISMCYQRISNKFEIVTIIRFWLFGGINKSLHINLKFSYTNCKFCCWKVWHIVGEGSEICDRRRDKNLSKKHDIRHGQSTGHNIIPFNLPSLYDAESELYFTNKVCITSILAEPLIKSKINILIEMTFEYT